jgi:hypothetical protein
MSQENVEFRAMAEAAFGALNSGDLDGFLAVATEDVEFTSLVAEVEGTTFGAMTVSVPGGRRFAARSAVCGGRPMWRARHYPGALSQVFSLTPLPGGHQPLRRQKNPALTLP